MSEKDIMKIALVTGGTEAIGAATVLELASRNFSVTIVGRNQDRGAQILEKM